MPFSARSESAYSPFGALSPSLVRFNLVITTGRTALSLHSRHFVLFFRWCCGVVSPILLPFSSSSSSRQGFQAIPLFVAKAAAAAAASSSSVGEENIPPLRGWTLLLFSSSRFLLELRAAAPQGVVDLGRGNDMLTPIPPNLDRIYVLRTLAVPSTIAHLRARVCVCECMCMVCALSRMLCFSELATLQAHFCDLIFVPRAQLVGLLSPLHWRPENFLGHLSSSLLLFVLVLSISATCILRSPTITTQYD